MLLRVSLGQWPMEQPGVCVVLPSVPQLCYSGTTVTQEISSGKRGEWCTRPLTSAPQGSDGASCSEFCNFLLACLMVLEIEPRTFTSELHL